MCPSLPSHPLPRGLRLQLASSRCLGLPAAQSSSCRPPGFNLKMRITAVNSPLKGLKIEGCQGHGAQACWPRGEFVGTRQRTHCTLVGTWCELESEASRRSRDCRGQEAEAVEVPMGRRSCGRLSESVRIGPSQGPLASSVPFSWDRHSSRGTISKGRVRPQATMYLVSSSQPREELTSHVPLGNTALNSHLLFW